MNVSSRFGLCWKFDNMSVFTNQRKIEIEELGWLFVNVTLCNVVRISSGQWNAMRSFLFKESLLTISA